MKILFLHGFSQSRDMFARKSSGLRKALQKAGHELLYVTAPVKIRPEDLPFDPPADSSDDMYGWWDVKTDTPDFVAAFDVVHQAIKEHGPFDGIVGFSQGAGLTAILTRQIVEAGSPPLKFCVLFAGFRLSYPDMQHWYEPPLTTPSLHIIGSVDTVVPEERSLKLWDAWDPAQRTKLMHPGGHFVPNSKPFVSQVVAFVNGHIPKEPTDKEESNDMSQFDSIGGV